jgi:hypothetical protein
MRIVLRLLPAMAALFGAASAAQAGMGPCKADSFDGLTCGSGIGAARVIEDTVSPDKRYAFAWRDPQAAPDAEIDGEQELDLLLVRLADGAVLASGQTGYWNTGHGRANRRHERAVWSPDSALVVRIYDTRFETAALQLYAPNPNGDRAGVVDLKKMVEPRVLARMKAKPDEWAFSVSSDAEPKLASNGSLFLPLMMWKPKDGPMNFYDVRLRVARGKQGPSARVTSVRETQE